MPIFDQGYQHWSGKLSGSAWRWLAVTRHGIRTGLRGKILRIVLLAAWVPALALIILLSLWGLLERKSSMVSTFTQFVSSMQPGIAADPQHYRVDIWRLAYHYFLQTEMRFSLILILLVGPSLISQDLRFNALPLYFSRPLRRRDYFLGKLGVIVAFLSMVVVFPSLVAYIFGLLFSLDLSIISDTFTILLGSIAYGLIIAVSAGMLIPRPLRPLPKLPLRRPPLGRCLVHQRNHRISTHLRSRRTAPLRILPQNHHTTTRPPTRGRNPRRTHSQMARMARRPPKS